MLSYPDPFSPCLPRHGLSYMDPPRGAGGWSKAKFGAGSIRGSDLEAQPPPAIAANTNSKVHLKVFIGRGVGRSGEPDDRGGGGGIGVFISPAHARSREEKDHRNWKRCAATILGCVEPVPFLSAMLLSAPCPRIICRVRIAFHFAPLPRIDGAEILARTEGPDIDCVVGMPLRRILCGGRATRENEETEDGYLCRRDRGETGVCHRGGIMDFLRRRSRAGVTAAFARRSIDRPRAPSR